MKILEVKNLKLGFGKKKQVLKDVSFSIEKGKVVGYVGRNASGKTTTIKTIMGLYKPEKGEVALFGETRMRKQTKLREKVGYVPEVHEFYDNLTVSASCEYISHFYPDWDKKFEKELISNFDLNPKDTFKSLSRGQKAKLFLTFALAHRPELIILDEPTSHLDPVARSEFWESTIALISETNASVFVSTHILNDIETIADQFILLNNGVIEFQTDSEELRQSVKKTFISESDLDKLTDAEKSNIILKKRLSKGLEIYMKNPGTASNLDWESLSIEEIIISYLKSNGDKK